MSMFGGGYWAPGYWPGAVTTTAIQIPLGGGGCGCCGGDLHNCIRTIGCPDHAGHMWDVLPGVPVVVETAPGGVEVASGTTDADGYFCWDAPAGDYRITATYPGYDPVDFTGAISGGTTEITLDVVDGKFCCPGADPIPEALYLHSDCAFFTPPYTCQPQDSVLHHNTALGLPYDWWIPTAPGVVQYHFACGGLENGMGIFRTPAFGEPAPPFSSYVGSYTLVYSTNPLVVSVTIQHHDILGNPTFVEHVTVSEVPIGP